jgi:chromosome segregation ATPase
MILATLALGATIAFNLKGNSVDAGYLRWALSNHISLFFASPIQYLLGDGKASSPLIYIGIGVFGLLVAVFAMQFSGDSETQLLRKRLKELDAAKNEAEGALQAQVWKGKTDRQAKDSAMKDLESSIDKIELLLGELGEKERLLKVRESELVTLKTDPGVRPGVVAARTQPADRTLSEELRKKTEALQARDAALKDLEQRLGAKTAQWETQLREKERQLKGRESELEGLRFQINDLNEQLSDMEAARKRADERLQEESRRRRELIEASELASKAEEQRLGELVHGLESQLRERDKILKGSDSELASFRRQLDGLAAAKDQAETSLKEQLAQKDQAQQSKEAAVKELEQRFGAMVQALRTEVGEKNLLLETRDGEIHALRTEVGSVAARLSETVAAKERAQAKLQEEQRKAEQRGSIDVTQREMAERHARELDSAAQQLLEKETALQARLGDLAALQSEVQAVSGRLKETMSAKESAEASLREELRQERQQRESGNRELAERYGAEVANLAKQLGEKEEVAQVRDGELAALKSEVKSIAERLNDTAAAKERAEAALQEELRKERQQREARESANRELEERYTRELQSAAAQLDGKEQVLKSRDGEVRALKTQLASLAEQFSKVESAKERAAILLQEKIRNEKQLREANDSALKELAESFNAKIAVLEQQLSEKLQVMGSRDSQVQALTSELSSLNRRLSEASAAKEKAESLFNEAIREKAEIGAAKDAAMRELQDDLTHKIGSMEAQLDEREQLLKSRDADLLAVKEQIADLGATKEQRARALQEEVRRKSEELAEREASAQALEERFSERVRGLESELSEGREQLAVREKELAALSVKVGSLTNQLANVGSSNDDAARALEQELQEQSALLQAKEAAIQTLENRLSGTVRSLEEQLGEKQELLHNRDLELDALMSKISALAGQVAALEAARGRSERQLQEELREREEILESKNAELEDMEERLNGRVKTLERQLTDKQKLLETGGVEIGDLRAQMSVLEERLKESENAKTWLEGSLQQARSTESRELVVTDSNRQPAALGAMAEDSDKDGLDSIRSEREALLKARDKLINDLMGELKEKKTQLAHHEIEVWQGIERRGVWKHRLSKIGIRLKD